MEIKKFTVELEFNKEIEYILGRPNFVCGGIARRLRELGFKIDKKAEAEQAFIILWFLSLYKEHGTKWHEAVNKILDGTETEKQHKEGDGDGNSEHQQRQSKK